MSDLIQSESKPRNGADLARVAEAVSVIRASVEVAQCSPRDEARAADRMLSAMSRPRMAEAAEYSFPRGGSNVTGPTIKLAREVARCWGNMQHGVRIVARTEDEIHVEGWAWDLETNTRVSKESRFAPKIQRRVSGETRWVPAEERDLNELIAKKGAVLVRNAILELIPSDLVDSCLARAAQTLSGEDSESLAADRDGKIAATCAAFAQFGVTRAQIERQFGDWTPETVTTLRKIFNALRDGVAKVDEFFGDASSLTSTASILERWERGDDGDDGSDNG